MAAHTDFTGLAGEWRGTNQLWVMPGEPARECETVASVELVAGDQFALIRYQWSDDGKAQDGVLLVRLAEDAGPEHVVWVDSWHTGGKMMVFRGEAAHEGRVSALGSYPAPPGPDWGWRIIVNAAADSKFQILMYNITPDGQEALAVDAQYTRLAG